MAAPNRVDELRKRYHEHPRRFFAPLANEYRKTGFLDRAILLCEKHLAEQPDNLNGLVVYGQTLFESGRHADAKGPFEMALNLDQENLIALRHLGDIARVEGDLEGARKWYERVLEFDRRNDEVLTLLEEVGGGAAKEPSSGPSASSNVISVASSVRVTSRGIGETLGMVDLEGPPGPPAPAPKVASPAKPAPAVKTVEVSAQAKPAKRASLMDIAFDFGEMQGEGPSAKPTPIAPVLSAEAAEYGFADATAIPTTPPPAPPRVQALEDMETLVVEPPRLEPLAEVESLIEMPPEPLAMGEPSMIEGLEQADYSGESTPLSGLESTEFTPGEAEPMSGLEAMEFEPPSADDQRRQSLAGLPLIEDATPAPEPLADLPQLDTRPRTPPVPARAVEEAETIALGAAEVRKRMETPPTFVTETMAELYLKQGFRDRALDVYRQLIAQSPADAGLRQRLAALEAAGSPIEFDVPAEEPEEPAPAPANAMLSDMSFDDLALSTPAKSTKAAPPPPPPEPGGPTAREVLAAFARRGFTPLSSPVIAAPPASRPSAPPTPPSAAPVAPAAGPTSGTLDALFGGGVDRDDDRAAHRLAGVGALSGPSGGSALDSLFGEGPSAPAPEALQSKGAPVARASDRLRFDQFFAGGDAAAPSEQASAEAPSAEPPSAREPASGEPPAGEDDLDQFQGWLRRLTQ